MRFNPKAGSGGAGCADVGGGSGAGGMGMPIPSARSGRRRHRRTVIVIVIIVFRASVQFAGGGTPLPTAASTPAAPTAKHGPLRRVPDRCGRQRETPTAPGSPSRTRCVDYWDDTLEPQTGTAFRPSRARHLHRRRPTGGCGNATSAVGPFYCPADETIYLDTTFFEDVLEGQLGGPGGDFVEPYVLGPRVRPPHPEPARHHGPGADPAGPDRATPYAWSSRPTATPACGPAPPATEDADGVSRSSRTSPRTTSRRRWTPPRRWATTGSRSSRPAGQPRGLDARLVGAADAVVRDRLRRQLDTELRHLLRVDPVTGLDRIRTLR